MDTVESSEDGDWAERKETEKNDSYAIHRYCFNFMSSQRGRPWSTIQLNFRVGVRGSIKETQFDERLTSLGVTNSKVRQQIRSLTVFETLALSDIILKLFHTSVLRSPEWAVSSLPTEISNTQTARLFFFKKFTGPFRGLVL